MTDDLSSKMKLAKTLTESVNEILVTVEGETRYLKLETARAALESFRRDVETATVGMKEGTITAIELSKRIEVEIKEGTEFVEVLESTQKRLLERIEEIDRINRTRNDEISSAVEKLRTLFDEPNLTKDVLVERIAGKRLRVDSVTPSSSQTTITEDGGADSVDFPPRSISKVYALSNFVHALNEIKIEPNGTYEFSIDTDFVGTALGRYVEHMKCNESGSSDFVKKIDPARVPSQHVSMPPLKSVESVHRVLAHPCVVCRLPMRKRQIRYTSCGAHGCHVKCWYAFKDSLPNDEHDDPPCPQLNGCRKKQF